MSETKIGLVPITQIEQKALLAGLDSFEDILISVHGKESLNPNAEKYKAILEPLKNPENGSFV